MGGVHQPATGKRLPLISSVSPGPSRGDSSPRPRSPSRRARRGGEERALGSGYRRSFQRPHHSGAAPTPNPSPGKIPSERSKTKQTRAGFLLCNRVLKVEAQRAQPPPRDREAQAGGGDLRATRAEPGCRTAASLAVSRPLGEPGPPIRKEPLTSLRTPSPFRLPTRGPSPWPEQPQTPKFSTFLKVFSPGTELNHPRDDKPIGARISRHLGDFLNPK